MKSAVVVQGRDNGSRMSRPLPHWGHFVRINTGQSGVEILPSADGVRFVGR